MNLLEFDGKQILSRYGIRIPEGRLVRHPAQAHVVAAALARPCVLKAQIPEGGRGKAGLVKFAQTPDEAQRLANQLFAAGGTHEIDLLLVEERLSIAQELYLAISVDDVLGAPVLMVSAQGGIDIEHHAEAVMRAVIDVRMGLRRHHAIDLWKRAGVSGKRLAQLAEISVALWLAFCDQDAMLIEINPLVVDADGKCWAADAKLTLDDNAAQRHPEWAERAARASGTLLERRAQRLGVNALIELPGDIAIVSTGASMSMLLLDRLAERGVQAANFMDLGGQSSPDARQKIIELVALHSAANHHIKAILIALIQTSKPIQILIDAIKGALGARPLPCPVFCWIGAAHLSTRDCPLDHALEQLAQLGISTFTDLDAALAASAAAGRA